MNGLQRADHQHACALSAHDVNDIIVFTIYRQSHQPFPLHVWIWSYEAFDGIAVGSLIAYAFREADASVLCAIDEDAFAIAVDTEEVVNHLDYDTDGTHERCGEQQQEYEPGVVLQEHVLDVWQEVLEGQVADVCYYGAQEHCKCQTSEVHEAAVSEDAAICMEYTESDGVGDEQYTKIPQDRPEMVCDLCSSVEEVVGKISTEYNCEVIDEQDAPIGKCAASEIPVGETREDVHRFYSMHLGKGSIFLLYEQEKMQKKVRETSFCHVFIAKESMLRLEFP